MKFWKSRLARLNNMFDSYIKENYKVVDYHVKIPSMREHNLTWRPYGYYKRKTSRIARSRCIAIKQQQLSRLDQQWIKKGESGWNLILTPLTF
jgi:endonuclease III-like uncharacterized protein